MAQHRGELLGIYLAVVSPGRFIAAGLGGILFVGRIFSAQLRRLALAGSGCGVGSKFRIAEVSRRRLCWRGFSGGRALRLTKKIALQGKFRLRVSGSRHGPDGWGLDRRGVGRGRPFMV
jgi:hypothetical protein